MKNQNPTITREELLTQQAEFIAKAEEFASAYNNAADIAAANAAEASGKAAVKGANECALALFKMECVAAADGIEDTEGKLHAVIKTACERHEYPAKAFKITAVSESVKTAEIVPTSKVIDLTSFNSVLLSLWKYRAELLAEFLTRDIATDIGFSSQKLKDAMAFFGLSKEAAEAPKVSKTTYKKVVPDIIAAMIGEEYRDKVVPADINYITRKFVTGGKSMVVKVASLKQTIALLADVCYRVLTDGFYDLDSKEIRKGMKKAAANAAK